MGKRKGIKRLQRKVNKTNMTTEQKIEQFVKESNDANRAFDLAKWEEVKNTIPAGEQASAEAKVRAEIKVK